MSDLSRAPRVYGLVLGSWFFVLGPFEVLGSWFVRRSWFRLRTENQEP